MLKKYIILYLYTRLSTIHAAAAHLRFTLHCSFVLFPLEKSLHFTLSFFLDLAAADRHGIALQECLRGGPSVMKSHPNSLYTLHFPSSSTPQRPTDTESRCKDVFVVAISHGIALEKSLLEKSFHFPLSFFI
jgi:hypothetical protein